MVTIMSIMTFRKLSQAATFPVFAFVLTGWGVLWICRFPIVRMGTVLLANASFLYHRQITVLDILVARSILAVFSSFVSFGLLFLIYMFTVEDTLNDPLAILIATFFVLWYVGVACIFTAAISAYTMFRERFALLFSVIHVFGTGAFFMVDWLPKQFQNLVLLLPMVDATELMRDGFFGNIVPCYYSIPYMFFFNIAFTFITLQLLHKFKKTRNINGIA